MYEILLGFHVLIALLLIGFILLQHGKGAQAGATFGGASQTVFGSQGSDNFLSRGTTILGTLFFVMNLFLAYIVNKQVYQNRMLTQNLPVSAPTDLPPVTKPQS